MKYRASANITHLIQSTNSQILGGGLMMLFYSVIFSSNGIYLDIIYLTLIHGVFAFLLSTLFRLPWGWRFFNFIFAPAAYLYMLSGSSPLFLLIAFIICFLLFIPALWSRVPYYPTSNQTYAIISDLLTKDKPENFIDIGCGFSGLLVHLAKKHPEIHFFGNEIGPLPYAVSKLKSLFLKNLKISFKSFWKEDFSKYSWVYCFLAPPPMEKLWDKVKSEMKAGSVFVSNTFEVPAKPNETIKLSGERQNKLLIFKI